MKPFCSTPPARFCYGHVRGREKRGVERPVARPLAGATTGGRARLPDRTRTVAVPRHPVRGRGAESREIAPGHQSRARPGGRLRSPRLLDSRAPPRAGLPVRVARPAVHPPSGHHAPRVGFGGRSEPAGGYARQRPSAQRAPGPESLPCRRREYFESCVYMTAVAARAASAEIILLDPLYSAHDQDENDTRAMAALCQSLLRLREASRAALVVVHHVRKSVGRYEIGSAFRGSSALHAVGDSYLLLTRPSPQFNTIELRFQFRYAAPQPPRLLQLDSAELWFSPSGEPSKPVAAANRRKVEPGDIRQALTELGAQARYNQLRQQIMTLTECSKRTAQM